MNEHLKGHKSLAEMVSTHIHIYREGLGLMAMNDGYDQTYVQHEVKALEDIKKACDVEQSLSDKQEAALPEVDQDWSKVEPSVAFHLIERHAEDWAHAGQMMEAWRAATTAAPLANPSDKQEADMRDAIYRKALAMGDAPDTIGPDTHEHHFEVDPASGIELCTYCRLSRVAAKKAAPLAQSAEQDRIETLQQVVNVLFHQRTLDEAQQAVRDMLMLAKLAEKQ
jgi:hypothetical protein